MRIRLASVLVAALALSGAACKGPTGLADNVVESFSGTIQPSMSDLKAFTVTNTGELKITLKALTPGGNAALGLIYGQPTGGGCSPAVPNPILVTSAQVGKSLLDFPIYVKGQYCLLVADYALFAGTTPLTVAQNYTIEVSHP